MVGQAGKIVLVALASLTLQGQGPAAAPAGNEELKALFDADQAARKDVSRIVPMDLFKADAQRRRRTHALLADGKLRTGDDFYHAAFIFQHGSEPADYLLAHSLAVAEIAAGRADAKWIAAASLDRYLQELHQPQIYGTQFVPKMDGAVTQEPYDRTLIPDSLRATLGVPTLAEQEKRRAEIQARRTAADPKR